MVTMESIVEIAKPVDEVFAFVTDQRNEARWHTDVVDAEPKRTIGPGDTVTWQVRFMGTNEYVSEVTEFEPCRRIRLTTVEGPLKPVLTHTFEDENGVTRYTRRVEIPLSGAFRVVGPIMSATGAARRRNARFTRNLKTLLES